MEITTAINNQLTYGTSLTTDVVVKQNIQKVNTITFGICVYILLLCTKNFYDHNYILVKTGIIDCALFLINHLTFRLLKRIKLYFVLFAIIQAGTIIETLFSGAYNGGSLLLVSIVILSIMNTSSIKYGSVIILFIISIELFVFKYHSTYDWLFTYPSDLEKIFFRFFTTQLGTYVVAVFYKKKENDLYRRLIQEKENRNRLFVNVVHDLKTPLTIIHNCVEQFLKGDNDKKSKELLKFNIDKMENDILNILNLHRLERGLLVADTNKVSNISELTTNICKSFNPYITSKNISIETKIENDLYVKIDQTSYTEVLNNLLDNAIKYTKPKGEIKVNLCSHSLNVSLSVEDTGIGIPDSQKEKVFDYYFKADNSDNSSYGLGIGLALIKEICKTFGGSINLESSIDIGSCFTVSFPKESKRLYIDNRDNSPGSNLLYKQNYNIPELLKFNENLQTILIIEDNDDIRHLLINNLKYNYNLICCNNGKEALQEYTTNSKIDLIITDLIMPVMNGKEFITKLRQHNTKLITPIIIITAKTEDIDVKEYLALGAIDYICKPFCVSELTIKIESILNIFKNRQNLFKDQMSKDIMGFIKGNYHSIKSDNNTIDHEKLREFSISKKEQRIIENIYTGMSYKEIAYQEGISLNTVKTYVYRIYKKCNINNSSNLIELFYSR